MDTQALGLFGSDDVNSHRSMGARLTSRILENNDLIVRKGAAVNGDLHRR